MPNKMLNVYMAADVRQALGSHPEKKGLSPGLLLDRFPYLPNRSLGPADPGKKGCKAQTIAAMHEAAMPGMAAALSRGRQPFGLPDTCQIDLALQGALIINHAGGLHENTGLALHRIFGTPYIPGSAVKGVARAAAIRELAAAARDAREEIFFSMLVVFGFSPVDLDARREASDFVQALKGDPRTPDWFSRAVGLTPTGAFAGVVSFLPANPVTEPALAEDIVNCHHPKYYRGDTAKALDNENPIPNAFPAVVSAKADTPLVFRFVVAFLPRWRKVRFLMPQFGLAQFDPLKAAQRWLTQALCEYGIGAKTAAGYGWFAPCPDVMDRLAEQERAREAEARRQDNLRREAEVRKAQEEEKRRLSAERKARQAAMAPADRADEDVAGWPDHLFRIRLENFCRNKGGPAGEDERAAMVRALRGPRAALWDDLKNRAARGPLAAVVQAIRKLCKDKGWEKLP
jgi:CRISPR type III-B/RAMP module RAMP protein Cmr6